MDSLAPVINLLSVSSTNKIAHVYAKAGVPSGFCISAKVQTGGYGSRGRNWVSPLGNLYMSTIWQQEYMVKTPPTMMVMLTALSIFDTLQSIGVDKNMSIKWPNDILISEKKVSGILIEHMLQGKFSDYAVIGIGINVFTAPKKIAQPVICLCEVCATIPSIDELIKSVLQHMRKYFYLLDSDQESIAKKYGQHLYKKGEKIRIQVQEKTLEGEIFGIDKDGALVIKTNKGIEKIYSGDIIVG